MSVVKIKIQRFIHIFICMTLLNPLKAQVFAETGKSIDQNKANLLLKQLKTSPKIQQNSLPKPYQKLLTHPLLTQELEKYYQRTAMVQKIYAKRNRVNNTYFRSIIMLVDNDKTRNHPRIAQQKKEAKIIALAFIAINLNALPEQMKKEVLYTHVPFGALLMKHNIEIFTTKRSYFQTSCDPNLKALVPCSLHTKIYGRTNTILKKNNHQWLAHVVEVLP